MKDNLYVIGTSKSQEESETQEDGLQDYSILTSPLASSNSFRPMINCVYTS